MMMVDSEAAEDEMLNTPAQQRSEPEEEVSDSMMMSMLTDGIAERIVQTMTRSSWHCITMKK